MSDLSVYPVPIELKGFLLNSTYQTPQGDFHTLHLFSILILITAITNYIYSNVNLAVVTCMLSLTIFQETISPLQACADFNENSVVS